MADIPENTETIPTTETPATPSAPEVVAETPSVGMEPAKDVETVAVAEGAEETPESEEAAEVPEVAPEPILFDAETDDVPVTIEKAQKVLDQYELPEEVQNAFNALTAKANSTPAAELAVYGSTTEELVSSLERQSLLWGNDELPDGSFRPKTHQFIAEIDKIDPEKNDWLFFDIANTPSKMYPKLTRFDEALVNYFGEVGEPIGDVMGRVQQVKEFMAQGLPQGDMPSFIPQNLRQAYFSLEPASRADIEALESVDEYGDALYTEADKTRKINELTRMQRGIDADRMEVQRIAQQRETERATFNAKVVETQNTVFSGVRDAFAASLQNDVKFSDDPKVQALLCNQQVTTLTQAFLPDADGEFARKALKDGGINFDWSLGQARIKAIEKASVEYTLLQTQVDEQGNQMNQVELNKAAKRLEDATRAFQEFGADIIRQEKLIATAGTTETVNKAVAKRKLELKTRPVPKAASSGNKQQRSAGDKPPANIAPFSKEWDEWYADKTLAGSPK